MKKFGYLIIMYLIYIIIKTYFGLGSFISGGIAGAVVGFVSWVIDVKLADRNKDSLEADKNNKSESQCK